MRKDQRGQVMPLVLLLTIALLVTMYLGITSAGQVVVLKNQAQTAADAAALAAATTRDSQFATELASKNGATVIHFEWRDGDAVVTVLAGNQIATARARPTAG